MKDPMTREEQKIRDLIALWHRATMAGDVDTVLGLMAEDVVFLAAGAPPMRGRSAFANALRRLLASHRIESSGEVQEVEVSGTLAYSRTQPIVRISTLSSGNAVTRTGSALSVLHKQADGAWVVIRDANMLAPVA